jgi:tetratricopeptide (TPR) repeat protein
VLFRSLPPALLEQAVRDAEAARIGDERMELLELLFDNRWRYSGGREPSEWWLPLSLHLYEHGRSQEAFAVAAHITEPRALIVLQADNRYAAIAKSRLVETDIARAAQKELARRRLAAAERPRDLGLVVEIGYALIWHQRYEEVLQLTDPVLARIDAAGGAEIPYDGMAADLPWLLDLRADALFAVGRHDEAVALLRRAVGVAKAGNAVHANNLANTLVELDRPQEALAALPDTNAAIDKQRAFAAMIRAIAAIELGDERLRDDALGELRGYARNFPSRLVWALTVAGKEDEAAAALIASLEDPGLRGDALARIQDYPKVEHNAIVASWREREERVRTRDDVRRVVAKYGRIRSYTINAL